jgi:hypothetical protein
MSNVQLYCKVQNVIMSCKSYEQLKIAKRYASLSQKLLDHAWCLDVIQLILAKEKELLSR